MIIICLQNGWSIQCENLYVFFQCAENTSNHNQLALLQWIGKCVAFAWNIDASLHVCRMCVHNWKQYERRFNDLMNFNVQFDKEKQKEKGRVHLIISLD